MKKISYTENGFQTFCEEFGKYGCYLNCLMVLGFRHSKYIMQPQEDFFSLVAKFIDKGWVHYGGRGDKDNFFVKDPVSILGYMTGKVFSVCKVSEFPRRCEAESDLEVLYYYNEKTKQGHFRLADFDGLENSITVRDGKIQSKRVFKEIK